MIHSQSLLIGEDWVHWLRPHPDGIDPVTNE